MPETIPVYPAHKIRCVLGCKGTIGKGKFSSVKLGYLNERKVAIKCFHKVAEDSKGLKDRVRREFELQRLSKYTNVLEAFQITGWGECIAIVMDYSPIGALAHVLCHIEGPVLVLVGLPQPQLRPKFRYDVSAQLRLRMACDVTRGLAHLHTLQVDKHVLHNDIKCENVLVMRDLSCKICDFGSGYLIGSDGRVAGGSCRIEYTWAYCAPEKLKAISAPLQLHALLGFSRRADMYSLGMVFFTLLLRRMPYTDQDEERVTRAILNGEQPRPDASDPLLLGEDLKVLKEMMTACWSEDPADRPIAAVVLRKLKEALQLQDERVIDENISEIQKQTEEESHEGLETVPLDRFCPETNTFLPDETQLHKRFVVKCNRAVAEVSYHWDRLEFLRVIFGLIFVFLVSMWSSYAKA